MPKLPTLPERIAAIREEIDELIDARVEIERAQCPGIPAGVLRNMMTARGCHCEVLLEIAAKDETA